MYQVTLFLGFPVDPPFASSLAALDPATVGLFIDDKEQNYLCSLDFEGKRYLGKYAGDLSTLTDLELLQNNIYSLLNRLVPASPCRSIPLSLLAVPASQHPEKT